MKGYTVQVSLGCRPLCTVDPTWNGCYEGRITGGSEVCTRQRCHEWPAHGNRRGKNATLSSSRKEGVVATENATQVSEMTVFIALRLGHAAPNRGAMAPLKPVHKYELLMDEQSYGSACLFCRPTQEIPDLSAFFASWWFLTISVSCVFGLVTILYCLYCLSVCAYVLGDECPT